MRLIDIANGGAEVPFAEAGRDPNLAADLQSRLSELSLLDAPTDGKFGPVSHWALDAFLARTKLRGKPAIDREVAQRLRDETADTLFPLNIKPDLAGRLVTALQAKRHVFARHPDCINIVYVEAMDPDGTANANTPNNFNDSRFILRINQGGRPVLAGAWEATTEPGLFWTRNPMNPAGAARIAFGQYKAWSVGTHNAGKKSAHEALVQTLEITVHRDLNQDFSRIGDRIETGMFGVNQHWGFDSPKENIGKASAGCLVGRTKAGHREFMKIVKADPRFLANNSYRFPAAILSAVDLGGR